MWSDQVSSSSHLALLTTFCVVCCLLGEGISCMTLALQGSLKQELTCPMCRTPWGPFSWRPTPALQRSPLKQAAHPGSHCRGCDQVTHWVQSFAPSPVAWYCGIACNSAVHMLQGLYHCVCILRLSVSFLHLHIRGTCLAFHFSCRHAMIQYSERQRLTAGCAFAGTNSGQAIHMHDMCPAAALFRLLWSRQTPSAQLLVLCEFRSAR